jgi:serine/threonine-protein kinase
LRGDYARAKALLDESLQMQQRNAGEDSPDAAATLLSLGDLALVQGQLDAAATHYASSRKLFEARLGPEHVLSARAQVAQADLLQRRGDSAAAEARYAESLPRLERAAALGRAYLAAAHCRRGAARWQRGDADAAGADASACLTAFADLKPEDHYERLEAQALAAAIAAARGDADARIRHAQALARLATILGPAHPRVLEARAWLR